MTQYRNNNDIYKTTYKQTCHTMQMHAFTDHYYSIHTLLCTVLYGDVVSK